MDTSPDTPPAPCDFCMRLDPSFRADHWADFSILQRTDGFSIVIALGALTIGHVMIVSERHYPSMAALPDPDLKVLMALTGDWAKRIEDRFGRTAICFEHGGGSHTRAVSGPCVQHAHMQILPMPSGFTPPAEFVALRTPFEALRSREYLYLRAEGRELICTQPQKGQYFRRLLASYCGLGERWDYLAFPNYDNMRRTLQAFDQESTSRA